METSARLSFEVFGPWPLGYLAVDYNSNQIQLWISRALAYLIPRNISTRARRVNSILIPSPFWEIDQEVNLILPGVDSVLYQIFKVMEDDAEKDELYDFMWTSIGPRFSTDCLPQYAFTRHSGCPPRILLRKRHATEEV